MVFSIVLIVIEQWTLFVPVPGINRVEIAWLSKGLRLLVHHYFFAHATLLWEEHFLPHAILLC